jgi:hypothetical protein
LMIFAFNDLVDLPAVLVYLHCPWHEVCHSDCISMSQCYENGDNARLIVHQSINTFKMIDLALFYILLWGWIVIITLKNIIFGSGDIWLIAAFYNYYLLFH